jgi:hypothetical protein
VRVITASRPLPRSRPDYTVGGRGVPISPRLTQLDDGLDGSGETDRPLLPERGFEAEREPGVLPDQHVPGHEHLDRLASGDQDQPVLTGRPEGRPSIDDRLAEAVRLGEQLLGGDLP